jgi:hypothetical protein
MSQVDRLDSVLGALSTLERYLDEAGQGGGISDVLARDLSMVLHHQMVVLAQVSMELSGVESWVGLHSAPRGPAADGLLVLCQNGPSGVESFVGLHSVPQVGPPITAPAAPATRYHGIVHLVARSGNERGWRMRETFATQAEVERWASRVCRDFSAHYETSAMFVQEPAVPVTANKGAADASNG